MTTIAVLALQGAFVEHEKRLRSLNCDVIEIRQRKDLDRGFDGIVLPGGESTVQARLLHELDLFKPLKDMIASGLPVLGTCAGLILLAGSVINVSDGRNPGVSGEIVAAATYDAGFQTMPVAVIRNGYGRQLGSFHTESCLFDQERNLGEIPMTFIRAPKIERIDPDVECLASLDGDPVAVRYGNQIASAFHPELDDNNKIYKLFIKNAL